jgi:hypothetical protein
VVVAPFMPMMPARRDLYQGWFDNERKLDSLITRLEACHSVSSPKPAAGIPESLGAANLNSLA